MVFGAMQAHPCSASRGHGCSVSFRMGGGACARRFWGNGGCVICAPQNAQALAALLFSLDVLAFAAGPCGKQASGMDMICVPGAGGKVGEREMTLPCPAGARGAAGVRIRRCLPLRGKSASELARLILGVSREKGG